MISNEKVVSSKAQMTEQKAHGFNSANQVSLRHQNTENMSKALGQYFTPQPIAKLLAQQVTARRDTIRNFLDLGAGDGALAAALADLHQQTQATLIEIDPVYVKKLRMIERMNFQVLEGNALSIAPLKERAVDAVISNPPYGSIQITDELRKVVKHSKLAIGTSSNWVRGDAAFIAKTWCLAQKGCAIGLIVAASILRDSSFKEFRRRFIGEMGNISVTKLPERTFSEAEVQTYLVTGRKSLQRSRNIALLKADEYGNIIDELGINFEAGILSLDIDYHRSIQRLNLTHKAAYRTLESSGVKITRGSKSQKEFAQLGLRAFHTTDFPTSSEITLDCTHPRFHMAQQGDILISRVGSRCLTKQARVQQGEGLFTDCVYRLKASTSVNEKIWKTLTSEFGKEWRLVNSAGSCARHLPISTLMTMPIIA